MRRRPGWLDSGPPRGEFPSGASRRPHSRSGPDPTRMGLPDAPALSGPPPATPRPQHDLVRVEPVGAWPGFDWPELWRYRGLLGFLVWREIKVRYAQTVLGAAWAVLQPLLSTVVFTVIFGRFA